MSSVSGAIQSQVEPTFDDFHRMVRFTHLEKAYQGAAWVRIDGDAEGPEIIKRLQSRYPSWEPDRFGCFSRPQFEYYYPTEFAEKTKVALGIVDKQKRREAKKKLLDEVRAWLDEDNQRGRRALEQSAAEVISNLNKIESQLCAHN